MPTDNTLLKYSTQDWRLSLDILTPRAFSLGDVDGYGMDVAAPADDPLVMAPLEQGYEGITGYGAISGSVGAGGFTTTLSVAEFPAEWASFFGIDLFCATVYGGIFGVVGAAGVDAGERGVRIFRGYQQAATAHNAYAAPRTEFQFSTSHAFLQRAGFSRGIDWAAGLDHSGPTTANAIIDHLLRYHTNLAPRSQIGIYVPDHALDAYSVNGGSLWDILQGLADNWTAGEGLVYCRREDDLFIGAHPGMIPDLHPNINDPILHITEEITLHGDGGEAGVTIPETEGYAVASTQVVATLSDQTTYASPIHYAWGSQGDRVVRQMRTDDTALADTLAARLLVHLNRKYRNVTVRLPLNLAVDLGDCVTLSIDGSNNNRGLVWNEKLFFVVGVSYQPDMEAHTMTCTLTLDEVAL